MSQYLDRMSIGACIDVDGPLGHITYEEPGCLRHLGEDVHVKHFVAVAGGTGITPIVQVRFWLGGWCWLGGSRVYDFRAGFIFCCLSSFSIAMKLRD